jgi:hypothetical protein
MQLMSRVKVRVRAGVCYPSARAGVCFPSARAGMCYPKGKGKKGRKACHPLFLALPLCFSPVTFVSTFDCELEERRIRCDRSIYWPLDHSLSWYKGCSQRLPQQGMGFELSSQKCFKLD